MRQDTAALAAGLIVATALAAGIVHMHGQAEAVQAPFPSREKVITVTGSATMSVQPDLLAITFGVETEAETASGALSANSAAMASIVDRLRSIGVTDDELGTLWLNIRPVYDHYVDPATERYVQELTGHSVTNTVTLTTQKLDLAAEIIDGMVSAGANRIDDVSFILSQERRSEAKDGLLEQAVLDAKAKAEKALAPLEHRIIGVKAVSLSEPGMQPPAPMYSLRESLDISAPVFASGQEITTTVNVVFLIGGN